MAIIQAVLAFMVFVSLPIWKQSDREEVEKKMKSLLSALRRHARSDVHCGGCEKTKTPFWSDGVLFVICG